MTRPAGLGGLPAAILVLCCVGWGLNQVAIKISLGGISPLVGAGLYGLLIGLLFAAEFVLVYWGLAFTTVSRSVIFLYSAPFFVALGAGAPPPWSSRPAATRGSRLRGRSSTS